MNNIRKIQCLFINKPCYIIFIYLLDIILIYQISISNMVDNIPQHILAKMNSSNSYYSKNSLSTNITSTTNTSDNKICKVDKINKNITFFDCIPYEIRSKEQYFYTENFNKNLFSSFEYIERNKILCLCTPVTAVYFDYREKIKEMLENDENGENTNDNDDNYDKNDKEYDIDTNAPISLDIDFRFLSLKNFFVFDLLKVKEYVDIDVDDDIEENNKNTIKHTDTELKENNEENNKNISDSEAKNIENLDLNKTDENKDSNTKDTDNIAENKSDKLNNIDVESNKIIEDANISTSIINTNTITNKNTNNDSNNNKLAKIKKSTLNNTEYIIFDPPFFQITPYRLREAIDEITNRDFTKKLFITYPIREEFPLINAFKEYNLKLTNVNVEYQFVSRSKWSNYGLFSNFEIGKIRFDKSYIKPTGNKDSNIRVNKGVSTFNTKKDKKR